MSWSALFTLTNVIAVVGWAMLVLLPRSRTVYSVILYAGVGLLCLTYAIMFAGLFGGFVDPARVAGAAEPDLTDYSVEGLRALFMSDGGIVLGWTHYLAFDLFVGSWIVTDGLKRRIPALLILPCLPLTFLFGPLGLLLFILLRLAFQRRQSSETL